MKQLLPTLRRRAGMILSVAEAHGRRHHPRFRGVFDEVVFAVYDPGKGQPNLRAFRAVFTG